MQIALSKATSLDSLVPQILGAMERGEECQIVNCHYLNAWEKAALYTLLHADHIYNADEGHEVRVQPGFNLFLTDDTGNRRLFHH